MNKMRKFLGAVLFGSAMTLSALDGWLVPTISVNVRDQLTGILPKHAIHAALCKEVVRGQQVTIYFNVGKPKIDEAGKIRISGTLTRLSPAGKHTVIFTDRMLFDMPLKNPGLIYTSPTSVQTVFESGDPVGRYRWELTLKDLNSGEVCKVKPVAVDLLPTVSDPTPMGVKEWETFITAYYVHPAPRRIMAALDYFLSVKDAEYKKTVKNYNPLIALSGFAQLFRLNPQLWPQLALYSKTLTGEQQKYLALIVNGIGSDAVAAMKDELPAETLKIITSFKKRNPLYAGNPTKPFHLDFLWMEFCVTGCKAPVAKILNELRKREIMTLEQAKAKADKKEKLTPAEQKKLLNFLMSLSAYRIITSAQKRGHRLPGYYVEAMIVRKELDPVVSALAAQALQDGSPQKRKLQKNKINK